jgi:hypothetical protein
MVSYSYKGLDLKESCKSILTEYKLSIDQSSTLWNEISSLIKDKCDRIDIIYVKKEVVYDAKRFYNILINFFHQGVKIRGYNHIYENMLDTSSDVIAIRQYVNENMLDLLN